MLSEFPLVRGSTPKVHFQARLAVIVAWLQRLQSIGYSQRGVPRPDLRTAGPQRISAVHVTTCQERQFQALDMSRGRLAFYMIYLHAVDYRKPAGCVRRLASRRG